MQIDFHRGSWTLTLDPSLPEPLPKLDPVAVGVTDLSPRIGLANSWAPDDVDTLGPQIVGRLLHIVDLERNHPISQMLGLWSRVDRSTVIADQLDGGAA